MQVPRAFQLAVHLRELVEHLAFADVDHDRGARDFVAGAQRQLGEHRQERHRQVVDAEVAEVLERADRLRLAGAGEAGEDDEARGDGRARRPPRRVSRSPRSRAAGLRPRALPIALHATVSVACSEVESSELDVGRPARLAELRVEALGEPLRGVVAAVAQQLVARRDLDQDREIASRRDRHPHHRDAHAEPSRSALRRGRADRTRAPAPSARAAPPARPASTSASTRRRTDPAR